MLFELFCLSTGAFLAAGTWLFYKYPDNTKAFLFKDLPQFVTYKLHQQVIEYHRDHYVLSYPFGTHWYKMIIPRRRDPLFLSCVLDADERDVTDKIRPFMGPGHNFHGMCPTPEMLGYDLLTFVFIDGRKKTFHGCQDIVL